MSCCALKERRARKVTGIEGCFGRHSGVIGQDVVGSEGDYKGDPNDSEGDFEIVELRLLLRIYTRL